MTELCSTLPQIQVALNRKPDDSPTQIPPNPLKQRLDQIRRPPNTVINYIVHRITSDQPLNPHLHRRSDIHQPPQRPLQLYERDVEEVPHVINHPLTHIERDRRRGLHGVEGVARDVEIGGVVFGEVEAVGRGGEGDAFGCAGEVIHGGLGGRDENCRRGKGS